MHGIPTMPLSAINQSISEMKPIARTTKNLLQSTSKECGLLSFYGKTSSADSKKSSYVFNEVKLQYFGVALSKPRNLRKIIGDPTLDCNS